MVQVFRSIPDEHPLNPDTGRFYRYAMVTGDGRAVYGQTWRDLCVALIDGYGEDAIREELTAEGVTADDLEQRFRIESATIRVMYALKTQVWLQVWLKAEHQTEVDALPAEKRAALEGSREQQPDITEWNEAVPLVLVQYQYKPYGPKPKPEGNIIWINPFTDESLLRTLHAAGELKLSMRDDLAALVTAS